MYLRKTARKNDTKNVIKKRLKSLYCMILILAILITSNPNCNVVYAGTEESLYSNQLKKDSVKNPSKQKQELKTKRTEYSTTFQEPDGKCKTEFYSDKVRFRDSKSGRLTDYDSSLVEIDEDNSVSGINLEDYMYENAAGDIKQYFPKELKDETPIITEYKDYQISLYPITYHDNEVTLEDKVKTKDLYGKECSKTNGVTYEQINNGVDNKWESLESGIKESIVLNERPVNTNFSYNIQMKGCHPVLDSFNEEGQATEVKLIDDVSDELVGYIPKSFMTDSSASGNYSEDCCYKLREDIFGTYVLTIDVSKDYLYSENVVYPVTIDPSVTWSTYSSIETTYVSSGRYQAANFSSSDVMRIGKYAYEGCCGYMRFPTLYSYCKNKSVNKATLTLTESGDSQGSKTLQFYRVSQKWKASDLTSNNQPTVSNSIYSSKGFQGVNNRKININMYYYINDMRRGTTDIVSMGFCIKAYKYNKSLACDAAAIYTSKASDTSVRPKLTIEYYDAPAKASAFSITPYKVNTGRNLTLQYSGINSPVLDYVQYRVDKYDDTTKGNSSYISYSSNTIIGSSSSGSKVLDTSQWPEGCYKVSVRGIDTYGVAGYEAYQIIHIDLTKPVISKFNNSAYSSMYTNKQPEINWSVDDLHFQSIELQVNDAQYYNISDSKSGKYKVPITTLKNGYNIFYVRAVDIAGNYSDITTRGFYFDNVAPHIYAGLSRYSSETSFCNKKDIKLRVGADETAKYFMYSINGGSYITYNETYKQSAEIEMPSEFYNGGEGIKNVKVKVVDVAGNQSNIEDLNYYFDDKSPSIDAKIYPEPVPYAYFSQIPTIEYKIQDKTLTTMYVKCGDNSISLWI